MFKNHSGFLILFIAAAPRRTHCFSSCLFKAPPSRKAQYALTGQLSQACASCPLCFHFSSMDIFCNPSRAGGVAECGDCIVVTSQYYWSRDCSFKGTVSEYGLCAIVCGLEIRNLTFDKMGPFTFVNSMRYTTRMNGKTSQCYFIWGIQL